ncbi:hypothetical protein ONS96_005644 [Cadophora gregata f. sp. sojae]|nr:hypothetical protein ONS96_005644 [Cadophora gregata f. sp. sojae]
MSRRFSSVDLSFRGETTDLRDCSGLLHFFASPLRYPYPAEPCPENATLQCKHDDTEREGCFHSLRESIETSLRWHHASVFPFFGTNTRVNIDRRILRTPGFRSFKVQGRIKDFSLSSTSERVSMMIILWPSWPMIARSCLHSLSLKFLMFRIELPKRGVGSCDIHAHASAARLAATSRSCQSSSPAREDGAGQTLFATFWPATVAGGENADVVHRSYGQLPRPCRRFLAGSCPALPYPTLSYPILWVLLTG